MLKLLKIISRRYKHYASTVETLWWVDILFPLFLSLALFTAFIYLTYKGPKDQRMASLLEEKMISFALKTVGPRTIKNTSTIAIVSPDQDISSLKKERDDYKEVITKIILQNPKKIIVYWGLNTEFLEEDRAFFEASLPQDQAKKIVFVAAPEQLLLQPSLSLSSSIPILTGNLCSSHLQMICLYDKHKKNWIIQYLVDEFSDYSHETSHHWISQDLPHEHSNYLLLLNDPYEFTNYSFSFILQQDQKLNLEEKIIFIGRSFNKNKKISPEFRVQTPLNYQEYTYTPLHHFWAQVTQMFIDKDEINILSSFFSLSLALTLSLFLALILFTKGPSLSFALLLSLMILVPLINAFLISLFRIYIPLVNCLCMWLGSFIALCFIKLSMESFKDWQIFCKEEVRKEAAQTKEHFISLMSHNLNTSIAKIYGMLDLLIKFSSDSLFKQDAVRGMELVVQMQHCIKGILVRTSMEERSLEPSILTLEKIYDDFIYQYVPSLKKFRFSLSIKSIDLADKNYPIKIDSRAFNTCVSALTSLFYTPHHSKAVDILIDFHKKEYHEKIYFEVQIKSSEPLDDILKKNIINFQTENNTTNESTMPLLHVISLQLIHTMTKIHDGELKFFKSQEGSDALSFRVLI